MNRKPSLSEKLKKLVKGKQQEEAALRPTVHRYFGRLQQFSLGKLSGPRQNSAGLCRCLWKRSLCRRLPVKGLHSDR
jgi:hypothetical protein